MARMKPASPMGTPKTAAPMVKAIKAKVVIGPMKASPVAPKAPVAKPVKIAPKVTAPKVMPAKVTGSPAPVAPTGGIDIHDSMKPFMKEIPGGMHTKKYH